MPETDYEYFCMECGTSFTRLELGKAWIEFCRDTPMANPDIDADDIPFCPRCLHDW